MKISLACDHGGYTLKNQIIEYLKGKNIEIIDNGTYSEESCDYPDFGKKTALDIQNKKADFGIVVCTSAEGISMTVNRFKGVRCGIGYNDEVCKLMRMHNDANVIAFGQKFMDKDDVFKRIDLFLSTPFEGGRHLRRVEKIDS